MKFVYQLEHGKAALRADKVLGVAAARSGSRRYCCRWRRELLG
jgi:hypothetical protein